MKPGVRELKVSGTDMETLAFPFLCAQRLFFVQLFYQFPFGIRNRHGKPLISFL